MPTGGRRGRGRTRRLAEAERRRAQDAEAATLRQKKLGQRLLITAVVSVLFAVAAGLQTWRANGASQRATIAAKKETEARKRADQSAKLATENEKLAKKNEERAKAQASIATSRQLAAPSPRRNGAAEPGSFAAPGTGGSPSRTPKPTRSRHATASLGPPRTDLAWTAFLNFEDGVPSRSVAFSPDGKTIAVGYNGVIHGG